MSALQHFILTRFNLRLWRQDKAGEPVRTREWLDHRFALFEHYCLPSLMSQTCGEFSWIVLFDSQTPDEYKQRIAGYQSRCPQLVPVYVEPKDGLYFADIFRREVVQRMNARRVLTTYLDNDDALHVRFVDDLQKRVAELRDGTFVFYSHGLQFYTDRSYAMQIQYPRNHFVSVVEQGQAATLRTIYGYGSHFYIHRLRGARIHYVEAEPMWCEVIHEKNMDNDAYFIRAHMMHDPDLLHRDFALDATLRHSLSLYLFRFLPRYAKHFLRRLRYHLFGRKWW